MWIARSMAFGYGVGFPAKEPKDVVGTPSNVLVMAGHGLIEGCLADERLSGHRAGLMCEFEEVACLEVWWKERTLRPGRANTKISCWIVSFTAIPEQSRGGVLANHEHGPVGAVERVGVRRLEDPSSFRCEKSTAGLPFSAARRKTGAGRRSQRIERDRTEVAPEAHRLATEGQRAVAKPRVGGVEVGDEAGSHRKDVDAGRVSAVRCC